MNTVYRDFMTEYWIHDFVIISFWAANMMLNDRSLSQVAIGMTADERGSDGPMNRLNAALDVFAAVLPRNLRHDRQQIYPVDHMSKQEIWSMLPPALRELTWSCRHPAYENNLPRACGKCKTCNDLSALQS